MKKTKEDATSAGTPKKKKPENKGRLSSMLESMQKRSSPVNAHKVATKYFEDFKKDRIISPAKEQEKQPTAVTTPVNTAESNAINTAVFIPVGRKQKKPSSSKAENIRSGSKILDESHTDSESRVYTVMNLECESKKSYELRFGLKELKEKTGLSDKTIRNAIHSLEEKMSIKIIEPSLGVYGRKIRVFTPHEISDMRKKSGLVIDPTTKRIIESNAAVNSAADTAVTTALDNASGYKNKIKSLYETHTCKKWEDKDDKFYESISGVIPDVVEAAMILGIMKDGNKNKDLSDFKFLINDLGSTIPKTYLNHLRDIWKEYDSGK